MVPAAAVNEESVFVEIQVGRKVRIATEMAANDGSRPVSDLLEDLLIDYLSKSGYLAAPVDLKKVLASN